MIVGVIEWRGGDREMAFQISEREKGYSTCLTKCKAELDLTAYEN